MALDPTAREANIRDSLKKYFVDNLHPQYHLMFDKGLSTPQLSGTPGPTDKWISINFGFMDRGNLSEHMLTIYCCTRKDNEGFKLAQLSDTVMGFLSDTTKTDSMARITLYKTNVQPWTVIGGIVVQEVIESEQYESDDETKYKILNARLRWSAKI